MSLPLHERAADGSDPIVRMTLADLGKPFDVKTSATVVTSLIPARALEEDEQYRFHFDVTKCIGCRSCEVACNEQNGNPSDIRWRRIGEIEGGVYPDVLRHYLSMGCNHCLDAECVKGCPVEAYTKDPVTGIVLHSADACIGCQYCVWNCTYQVPQFNAERGVVGKCDMCHGRLTAGLEPACVNACPEAAIEIEIVNKTAWRKNFTAAESPGLPAAMHTLSTTRLTLPESATKLERVDAGHIRPEHAHLSLVFMTTLIQAVTGGLFFALIAHGLTPLFLTMLLGITAIALNISVFHLGRPAYAWRAVKMWRRSWLSREVLFFGHFFGSLAICTAFAWAMVLPATLYTSPFLRTLQTWPHAALALTCLAWITVGFGCAGTIASAFIYLIPARPSWNMVHTPFDFLLSGLLIGGTFAFVLQMVTNWMATLPMLQGWPLAHAGAVYPFWPVVVAGLLWMLNHVVRLVRLSRSPLFEGRASIMLLNRSPLRAFLIASFVFALGSCALALVSSVTLSCLAAFLCVLLARYLFFVSVVPLNMALTFTRGGHA
ncbi:nitrate reductase (quinol-dependent), transmembrane subunit [Granulicella rosea]|uniref:Nitrate reductase (Quinol-dependent), transmembrane subunit n=1 Tax=Granulicella rosea TaxID=474952 RepID=A0A239EL45_9BACT|nr:DmsC/YnfH family molybdoenzyme membrane anchor subunit [Granulicella rosea]SNS45385.1 nitrate reductase (quinol-dependent), transmembrane subunit [Granulicella rosea]